MFTTGPVKFRADGRLISGSIEPEGDRFLVKHPYNQTLIGHVKVLEGSKYHGYDKINPRKVWSVADSQANRFRLDYLTGGKPHARYDAPLIEYNPTRPMYEHQIKITQNQITRRHFIVAAEMGCGKSLATIEALEWFGYQDCFWVGPKSALAQVQLEFWKWQSKIRPIFMTYDKLVSIMTSWPTGTKPPRAVVFDEASRVRNATSQRGQAAMHLTDAMRIEHGVDNSFITLLSGTPAPKDPTNWFHLARITCPGFLRECNMHAFKNRLGLIKKVTGFDGMSFPKLITWYDNEKKCKECGQFLDHDNHDNINMLEDFYHDFTPSKNEVSLLYERMKGLVGVWDIDTCLDLPEIVYEVIECPPSPEVERAAKLIMAAASTTIQALTLCRELSDGFQYKDVESGRDPCPVCKGEKVQDEYYDEANPDQALDGASIAAGRKVIYNEYGVQIGINEVDLVIKTRKAPCLNCNSLGTVPNYSRETTQVECPKEEALLDLLDLYEDQGRVVVWGGFTGTIDRLVSIVLKRQWTPIRIDGRGWWSPIVGSPMDLLKAFADKDAFQKVAIVSQPGAGGMGLDFTASNVEIYYSNTFNGEDRTQSEARFRRPGADHKRGCKVIDLYHLPTDKLVHANLKVKRDLERMSLGLLRQELEKVTIDAPRAF